MMRVCFVRCAIIAIGTSYEAGRARTAPHHRPETRMGRRSLASEIKTKQQKKFREK